jgi:hypothetical protein
MNDETTTSEKTLAEEEDKAERAYRLFCGLTVKDQEKFITLAEKLPSSL